MSQKLQHPDDGTADEAVGVPFLTLREAAHRLNLSEKAVRRLITRGDLCACKVAGRIRIDPADLDDFVVRSRVAPPSPAPAGGAPCPRPAGSLRALLDAEKGST